MIPPCPPPQGRPLGNPSARLALLLSSMLICFTPAASESACSQENQQCGALGNLPYPFGKQGSFCGASPSFQLSDCSAPTSAHWDAFYGRPAVLQFNESRAISAYLNLTWAVSSPSTNACQIHPAEQLHLFLPNSSADGSGIDLRSSPDFSAFSVSPNSIFLLFNCSSIMHANSSNYVELNSKACESFRNQCPDVPAQNACVQFQPQWQLDLPKALSLSQCSHFQFLVTMDPSLPVFNWKPHVVQLMWAPQDFAFKTGIACQACENSNGTCGYDGNAKFRCFCPNNQSSAEDCNHPTDADDESNTNAGGESKTDSVLALKIATPVVAGICIVSIVSLWWRSRKRRVFSSRSTSSSSNGPKYKLQKPDLLSFRLKGICAQEYSYGDILEATLSFADDNIIGDGGFGSVYRGTLKDGRLIAVKRLFPDAIGRINLFYNEIQILVRLSHPNLVKFYGFCRNDDRNLLLVFEYLSNGSVFDQLHPEEDANMKGRAGIPSWRVRLRLAMETAEALSYLHNSMNPPILHRDVKTTNILLDERFHAKLADFGLSRLVPLEMTHISTAPQGTLGYLDPEYHSCCRLTDKSDVYSFGVVLLELVSSEKAVDFSRSEKDVTLASKALSKKKKGSWKELVDVHCWNEADTDANVVVGELVQLAFKCLQPEGIDRPCMSDVSATLAGLWQRYSEIPSYKVKFTSRVQKGRSFNA